MLRGIEGLGAGARGEARRVLDVLIERGDVSLEEADRIEAGIESAIATHRRWLEERVLAPLRGAGEGAGRLDARLAALEERLARIEARLAARDPGE